MKTKYILISVISFLSLVLLSGCYTSMGTVRYHRVYDEDVIYEDEELSENTIGVYHHYYTLPYVSHRFVYYDPYDYWYDDPGFYISVGYYNRSYYYYSNYYGCIYPGWYPVVYHPYYIPAWYYGPRYQRQFYAYNKRDFHKRRDLAGRRFDRRYNHGDYRDGEYINGSNNGNNKRDNNYGRRVISRRTNSGNIRNEIPSIASRKNVTTKRQTNRSIERIVKTRPIAGKRTTQIESNRKSREQQVKRYYYGNTSGNDRPIEKGIKSIERRSAKPKQNFQTSKVKSDDKTKTRRSVIVNTKHNRTNEKSKSSSSRSYNRPKVRENSKSTVTKQSKRSGSSRASYSPKKSKSTSSSGSSRKRGRR